MRYSILTWVKVRLFLKLNVQLFLLVRELRDNVVVFPIQSAHIYPTSLPMPVFESHLYDTLLRDGR